MAQNEMKAMRGLPVRVRSMEGLGAGSCGEPQWHCTEDDWVGLVA